MGLRGSSRVIKGVILAPLVINANKDLTDPSNYRPIALLMAIIKLFESIQQKISDFFEGEIEGMETDPIFSDHTTGFRHGMEIKLGTSYCIGSCISEAGL